jgi:hypothetical protein
MAGIAPVAMVVKRKYEREKTTDIDMKQIFVKVGVKRIR